MTEYPVLEYTYRVLSDEVLSETVGLDKVVLERWDRFMEEGNFRYNTDNIKERVVKGQLGYLVQSQLERARLRRTPQSMLSISQAFDEEKFNFNKIDESKELVCQLVNNDRKVKHRDILIINVSPVDRGHCLLVPEVEAGQQQVLTVHSITLALEVMMLSVSPHIKLAFNSLCAYASVNHLHWHLYYQPTTLSVQTLPLSVWPGTPYYTFTDQAYPALGWVWLLNTKQINKEKVDKLAGQVAKLTRWLTEMEVAHNVVLTRGAGIEGGPTYDHVRVLVWARESVIGAKDPGQFVIAALELTGQILVYETEKYNNIVEEEIVEAQKKATVAVFSNLRFEVQKLYVEERSSI